jgi:pentatricopeptide repeat protein
MRQILCLLLVTACSHPTASKAPVAPAHETERFDEKVRADFFDGLRGDQEAMNRAMKVCEDTLAKNPKHAEAMVWHGAGIIAESRDAFRTGDKAHGIELYSKGLAEMDEAVTLAPDNVGVRIPRGAVLLAMAPFVPEPEKTKLLERGVADYERTYELQKAYFPTLTLHSREQLLYGLTDGYANLGETDKAKSYFEQMQAQAAGSELLPRAASRAKGEAVDGQTPCEQCHRAR